MAGVMASEAQRQFNKYPGSKPIAPDVWRTLPKDQKRDEAERLVAEFLAKGGTITKAPPQKSHRGRAFTKDTKAPGHGRDVDRYFSGGHQWESRAVSERSSAKRQDDVGGAVVSIGGKLVSRHSIADHHVIDLVSDKAERESAKRNGVGRKYESVTTEDAGDDISDACGRATIKDDLTPDIDKQHRRRFKLAA
jgi:hypothetical protein